MINDENWNKLNKQGEDLLLIEKKIIIRRNKKIANNLFNKQNEVVDKLVNKSVDFFKHLTTILTGFLGLLIGLSPIKSLDQIGKILFLGSILTISLCILLSISVIYLNIEFLRKTSRILLKKGKESLDNVAPTEVEYIEENVISFYLERISLIFLALSVVSIFSYAANLAFYSLN